ncbi:tyrosine-type recombinase/integrase [Terracidiphilus gabretensis]|uniref:tyrosine-type recombinase/integrase n=1 Tax=Terracidiphilus gabretensis TaxID=1577687 RepID=UPI00071BF1A7|nr:tyrosine-type recombinase/integrase [Terracidiphilus gabretensis]
MGGQKPREVRAADIAEFCARLEAAPYTQGTKALYVSAAKRVFKWLHKVHGTVDHSDVFTRFLNVRPRNIVATEDEWNRVNKSRNRGYRLMLHFCSVLALRSGTAVKLSPEHYDSRLREIRTTTKYGTPITIPIPEDIAAVLDECDLDSNEPFVKQLWSEHGNAKVVGADTVRRYHSRWRKRIGIERDLRYHDFRRAAAVAVYRRTRDLNAVRNLLAHKSLRSTVHYLDHDREPVEASLLEAVRFNSERKIA